MLFPSNATAAGLNRNKMLRVSCEDRKGIMAAVCSTISVHDHNIEVRAAHNRRPQCHACGQQDRPKSTQHGNCYLLKSLCMAISCQVQAAVDECECVISITAGSSQFVRLMYFLLTDHATEVVLLPLPSCASLPHHHSVGCRGARGGWLLPAGVSCGGR